MCRIRKIEEKKKTLIGTRRKRKMEEMKLVERRFRVEMV